MVKIEAVISHKRELEHLKVKLIPRSLNADVLVQSDTGEGLSYSKVAAFQIRICSNIRCVFR